MTITEILDQARNLSIHERKTLVKLLIDTLDEPRTETTISDKHSILELAGLGKEIWKGIDAQEYVNQLRNE